MPGNVVSDAKGKAGEQSPFLASRCWRQDGPVISSHVQNIHANLYPSTHVLLILFLLSDLTFL